LKRLLLRLDVPKLPVPFRMIASRLFALEVALQRKAEFGEQASYRGGLALSHIPLVFSRLSAPCSRILLI
jgi:hypothetical protein